MALPPEYPFRPPRCRFVSRIFHPNVRADTGQICLNIINEDENEWTPANTLIQVAYGIQSLVNCPNTDSPLNLDAGNILRQGDLRCYGNMVRYFYVAAAAE